MPNVATNPMDPTTAVGPAFVCLRTDQGSIVAVTVRGELDVATVPAVRRVLRGAQADAETVLVDLRELEFIDSRGAQMIVEADRDARATGARLLVACGPEALWYFQLAGLDSRLQIVREPDPLERLAL